MNSSTKTWLVPSAAVLILLCTWEVVCRTGLVPSYMLPAPTQVIAALVGDAALLAKHSGTTLLEAAIGLSVGVILGFAIAVAMDRIEILYLAFQPLLTVSQTVPTIAIAPLLVLWFGYGILPKVVLIVLTTFFPIAVSLVSGFRSVDPDEIDLMHTMGANDWQIFRYVKLPAAGDQFFAGLKISATYAIVAAVIAEWLGGFSGLGVYMTRVRKSFSYDKMFASIVVISLLSLALMWLVGVLEKVSMPWKAAERKNMKKKRNNGMALMMVAVLALSGVLGLSACQPTDKPGMVNEAPAKVSFVLDYSPNVNHTGIYAAIENGWFLEEGIEVELVPCPADGSDALIGSGGANMGMTYQDYIANSLGAAEPMPYTAVATVVQHNTSGIMSRAEDGITSPGKMAGKRYATWNLPVEQATIKHLVEDDGASFDDVELVPYEVDDDVMGLQADLYDCVWVYEWWAVANANLQNYPVNYFAFGDMSPVFDFYTPVIAVNDTWAAENPELVKAFLRAAKRGYEYAAEYPKEAGDLLCKAVPELDPALIQEAQAIISPQYIADASSWGVIDEERWSGFYQWINDYQLSEKPFDPKAGFTMEYLEH